MPAVQKLPGGLTSGNNTIGQAANPQAPQVSSTTSGYASALVSSRSIRGQGASAGKNANSPAGDVKSDVEELRQLQEVIPSNPNATRRQPKRADFPQSTNLEVVQPVTGQQIEFAIVILQDCGVVERSLEQLARILQDQYRESTYILIRCPVQSGNSIHGWASGQDDLDFIGTCRMLLLDIICESLIVKCGFKTRQIVVLGHGQGGTAALTAVSLWHSIQFAGVIAIGDTMPAGSDAKSQTPALLLGSFPESNTTDEVFTHITRSNHLTSADIQNLAVNAPEVSINLLEPIREFFDHRLRREEWNKQAILSLDGGGIRGYGTLLIVRELMNKIGDVEKGPTLEDGPAHSSFFPCPFRPVRAEPEQGPSLSSLSHHSMRSPGSYTGSVIVASPHGNLPNSSLFYPCHYFTYAAGTSTGGLISIMLSRLRMSVDECIEEYKSLGQRVFGHPRPLSLKGLIWHKYNHKVLEEVVRSVTARYKEESEFEVGFPSAEELCRTIVLAYANTASESEVPYIFRTYRTLPLQLDRSRSMSRQRTFRNQGSAPGLPIWQIARATSAAPGYFPPIKIQSGSSQNPNEVILFKDGGFGANNPSKEAFGDVVHKHGGLIRNIGPFVSIGTGAHSEPIFAEKPGKLHNLKANFNGAIAHAGRTKSTHDDMAWISNHGGTEFFPYFRFEGGEDLGKIPMDEWRSIRFATMRGKNSTRGYKTIDDMDRAMSAYLRRPDVQNDLNELAKILVKRRRLRSKDGSAWDRYASASYFECTHQGCEHKQISTREKYEEHLRDKHGMKLAAQDLESDMKRSRRCWLYRSKESGHRAPDSARGETRNFTASE